MPNQQNFSMPGPNFEDDKNSGWIKNNYHKIVPVLIAALAVVLGLYFFKSYQTRTMLLKPTIDRINSQSNLSATGANQIKTNNEAKKVATPAPKAETSGNEIIVTAVKGNGATHLARQALKEYLKDKPELAQKLEPEHRIFIEDYLRKNLNSQPKTLHPDDQLTFSNNSLQSAINRALTLNDSQIKNLGKYVPLAPSLMTP